MKRILVILMLIFMLCACDKSNIADNYPSTIVSSNNTEINYIEANNTSLEYMEGSSAIVAGGSYTSEPLPAPNENGWKIIEYDANMVWNYDDPAYWMGEDKFIYFCGRYLYGVDINLEERQVIMEVNAGIRDYYDGGELFLYLNSINGDSKMFRNPDNTRFYVPTHYRAASEIRYNIYEFLSNDFSYLGKSDENLEKLPEVTIDFKYNSKYEFVAVSPDDRYYIYINLTKSNINSLDELLGGNIQKSTSYFEVYDYNGNFINEFIDDTEYHLTMCKFKSGYSSGIFSDEAYLWDGEVRILLNDKLYYLDGTPINDHFGHYVGVDSSREYCNLMYRKEDGTEVVIRECIAPRYCVIIFNNDFTACAWTDDKRSYLGVNQWELPKL